MTLTKAPELLNLPGGSKPSNAAGAKLRARTRQAAFPVNAGYNTENEPARKRRLGYSLGRVNPSNRNAILINKLTTANIQALLSKSLARNEAFKPLYMKPGAINTVVNAEDFGKAYARFLRQHAPQFVNQARNAFNKRLNELARNNPTFSNFYTGRKVLKKRINNSL